VAAYAALPGRGFGPAGVCPLVLQAVVRRVGTPADRVGASPSTIGVCELALPLQYHGKTLLRLGGAEQERLMPLQGHSPWISPER
jgi:hypothetical protein